MFRGLPRNLNLGFIDLRRYEAVSQCWCEPVFFLVRVHSPVLKKIFKIALNRRGGGNKVRSTAAVRKYQGNGRVQSLPSVLSEF